MIGNACYYDGVWKEHALVMKTAASLMSAGYSPDDATFGPVRVFVLGSGNSSSPYRDYLQVCFSSQIIEMTTFSSSILLTSDFLFHIRVTKYIGYLQVMAQHVGLPSGVVQHVGVDEDIDGLLWALPKYKLPRRMPRAGHLGVGCPDGRLWASYAVVYTSVTEEHGFPPILVLSSYGP